MRLMATLTVVAALFVVTAAHVSAADLKPISHAEDQGRGRDPGERVGPVEAREERIVSSSLRPKTSSRGRRQGDLEHEHERCPGWPR